MPLVIICILAGVIYDKIKCSCIYLSVVANVVANYNENSLNHNHNHLMFLHSHRWSKSFQFTSKMGEISI